MKEIYFVAILIIGTIILVWELTSVTKHIKELQSKIKDLDAMVKKMQTDNDNGQSD